MQIIVKLNDNVINRTINKMDTLMEFSKYVIISDDEQQIIDKLSNMWNK